MRRRLRSLGKVLTAWQVTKVLREHWSSIPSSERQRVRALLRQSRLRNRNLSRAQRAELRELIRGLGLVVLGQRLTEIALAKRRGARRRR